MMKTEIERIGDDKLRLDVEVPVDELEHAMSHTMEHLASDMSAPGFRKGKVPPQMVLARLGRETVLQEVINHYLGQWYVSAVTATGIRPVAEPEIDFSELPAEGQPLSFSASVQVAPKPKLPDLAGLEAERPMLPDVTELVDEVLESTLAGAGTLVDADRAAENGDEVVVDFTCSVDGEAVTGAAARGYQARLGDGRLLQELEEAIVGQEAGSELTVPVNFPADHPMTQLAGKDAEFQVNLREVQTLDLPKLTDEVASKVSEFDTADALTGDIRERIESRLREETEGVFRANAVAALVEAADVDAPAPMVESRKNEIFQAMRGQLEQSGTSLEGYLAAVGQDFADFTGELDERAKEDVERELCLLALAEELDLEISEDDLWDEVRRHATEAGEDAEAAINNVKLSGRGDMLRGELLIQKTVDELVTKVKPIDVDPKELEEREARRMADLVESQKADADTDGDGDADTDTEPASAGDSDSSGSETPDNG